ncbi:type II restriction endonuclease [Paracraurococcus lichenis]|uniref:Type II restriction endonuclease n=1 Tax=Paracraurococcus lichenis TaxID=3064888 RepID=A0ABT9DY90_9PROT|nr:type II restriction endonuclease [Paracraurococcus sp. LOR1-02]MDO9708879.1 type II restriction endonuclease [Paracraurococcus sp. LOR1-02]
MSDALLPLISKARSDPGSTYRTWFLGNARVRGFRSVRRGIQRAAAKIEAGTFGCVYRGSALEEVVGAIAAQGRILNGTECAFLWRPKLHSPDIYKSTDNQHAFGRMLDVCLRCGTESQVIAAIRQLDAERIRGVGPTSANLLYFLHPTIVPLYSTAIVDGFNALTGSKMRPGRWDDYLAMRRTIAMLNARHRTLLSDDLGAISALLFDVGSGRYPAPPCGDNEGARAQWVADLARVRAEGINMANATQADNLSHTEVQGLLRDLGSSLGFDIWVAANDRNRPFGGGKLGDRCLPDLPGIDEDTCADAIRLIDVLWLDPTSKRVVSAFEVEHTTDIAAGLVRMLCLALGPAPHSLEALFVVAPDRREREARSQFSYPAFKLNSGPEILFLPYGALQTHKEAIARFGAGVKAIQAISRRP